MRMRSGSVSARSRRSVLLAVGVVLFCAAALTAGCADRLGRAAPQPVAEGEHDPAAWGAYYPAEYERWLATADKRPAGLSRYKRGFDGGVTFDKLSEYPFMAVLFNGWGFGVDYNEPRGHHYMLIDQQEADPSRVKAGGACLTCKSPYAQDLYAKDKAALFGATYAKAVGMLPAGAAQLGVSCIDCHDARTMEVRTRRWTVDAGLREMGTSQDKLQLNQRRTLVCGQCHCTYSVMKDGTRSVEVDFPWEGSAWGTITVENIIKDIETQKPRHEWVQNTTGMKLGFIRHPDFEFYTAGSPHVPSGVSCPDCHMPQTTVGNARIADHDPMSPLKYDKLPCLRCHAGRTDQQMRETVFAIQRANLVRLIDAGYRTATVAKLFELANRSLTATSGEPVYDEAAAHYRQAFYRVVYMGAENSVGFHNPAEGRRILTDASREAATADAILRKLLAAKGVKVPAEVDLQLLHYLNGRGVKKLHYHAEQNVADPSGQAQRTWPANLRALAR